MEPTFTPVPSSPPIRNVAPGEIDNPLPMMTGAPLKQNAPSGTTTWPYEPGGRKSLHVVVPVAADAGPPAASAATAAATHDPSATKHRTLLLLKTMSTSSVDRNP